MSEKLRGGSIFIDEDGKQTRLREPTKMGSDKVVPKPLKAKSKSTKKGEK